VSYIDLVEQRIKLLLKKSEGKATESDLKELESVAVLMCEAVSSVASEEDKKFLEWADKEITTLESNLVKRTTDDPTDLDLTLSNNGKCFVFPFWKFFCAKIGGKEREEVLH